MFPGSHNSPQNLAAPKKALATSNVDNLPATAAPTLPDADKTFLEMVLEAHEATPSKGIRIYQIRSFIQLRYRLPEPGFDQILTFTLKFAVDSQLLVRVKGRKDDPMSWSTRLNPTFILILLRRVREEAKIVLAAAEKGQKRKAEDGDEQTSQGVGGGAGGKMAKL